jgi:hypothetical protein
MISLLLATFLGGTAFAQSYSFPTSAEDWPHFYPTAYRDEGSRDWECGSFYYSSHRGSDFGVGSWSGMSDGRDVTAAKGGVVVTANDGEFDQCSTGDCAGGGGFGNYVAIEHDDGTTTYYAHMAQWSVAVNSGETVSCGQVLGQVGSSGYSTGPHLHFEPRQSGASFEPFSGSCGAWSSSWTVQGSYGGVPEVTCAASSGSSGSGSSGSGSSGSGSSGSGSSGSGSSGSGSSSGCTSGSSGSGASGSSGSGSSGSSGSSSCSAGVPGAPVDLTPRDYDLENGSSVTLHWAGIGNSSTWYDVEIWYWDGAEWDYYYSYSPTDHTKIIWPYVHNAYYAWAVRGQNGSGAGAWSEWATFLYAP